MFTIAITFDLKTPSERNQNPFAWFDVCYETICDMNECNK